MEIEASRDAVYILKTCAAIESYRADAYEVLAEAYRDNPKISGLFHKTANEERNHEYQFLLALKKFIPVIAASSLAVQEVERYAVFARESLESLRKEIPPIADALKMAVLSETAFRKFHMDTAVLFEDTSLTRLFMAMMAGDDEHVASLKRAHADYLREAASHAGKEG